MLTANPKNSQQLVQINALNNQVIYIIPLEITNWKHQKQQLESPKVKQLVLSVKHAKATYSVAFIFHSVK